LKKRILYLLTACVITTSAIATNPQSNVNAASSVVSTTTSGLLQCSGIAAYMSTTGVAATSVIAAYVSDDTAEQTTENTETTETAENTDSTETTETTTDSADTTETTDSTETTDTSESSDSTSTDSSETDTSSEDSSDTTDDTEASDESTEEASDDSEESNLCIAQVDNYVYIRSEPSADSEYVGKLYDNSVGEIIEDDGEWLLIKSGDVEGYVCAQYVKTGDEAKEIADSVGERYAKVTTTTLFVREEASTDSAVIGMVPIDDELTVLEELDGWVKVSIEEGEGYVSTDYVTLYTEYVYAESKEAEEERLAEEEAAASAARAAASAAVSSSSSSSKSSGSTGSSSSSSVTAADTSASDLGAAVASYAVQFVGNPYVWGGTSLTNGADCSGFVMSVYAAFGVSLPHSSSADKYVGYEVEGGLANAQPGDIICYSGHVAIYIGNGQIVHASTAATGIKISSASYRTPVAVRRIF